MFESRAAHTGRWTAHICGALAALLLVGVAYAAANLPALTGRIVDQANIIPAETRNAIEPKPVEDAKPLAEAKPAAETKKAGKSKAAKSAKATPKAKAAKGKKAAAGTPREGTHKAQVIAMLQRKGGATLEAIMEATGWQKHTVRGFISILGSKGGMKIASTRRESDGARVYEA